MYDCCDGDEQKKNIKKKKKTGTLATKKIKPSSQKQTVPDQSPKIEEYGKNILPPEEDSDDSDEKTQDLWERGTENPDHKLAILNAANTGFQSRMNVCYYIYYKLTNNILI